MSVKFLSKTKITENFLIEVTNQLKQDRHRNRTAEEQDILDKIIKDPTLKTNDFTLQENEYNFLIQNKKSLWADYLIFRYKFKIYPFLKQLTNFPIHLLVEPVSYCNLKCIMCFQSDPTFTKQPMGHIAIKLFKKIIDEAVTEKCRALTMASRGEPTLHPKFGEILKYVKGKFFDLKLNTNAMLLDEEKCHQILENEVTELVFSIDSFEKKEYERTRRNGKFEQVVNNIKRFHNIRKKEYPQSKCRTRISGVKYKKNFNVKHFVKFWEQIVDNVTCVTMHNRWDSYHNKPSNKDFPCRLLWQRIYIWFDGTANPCDYDYKSLLKVGNVHKTSIKKIWTGKKFTQLRKDHLEEHRQRHIPCDRCDRCEN